MDLIGDTHALAWLASDHPRLSRALVEAMGEPETRLFVSSVTAYEYSDLAARKRLPAELDIDGLQTEFGFTLLDYPAALWQIAAQLPDLHRDPVDRMLIAHAIALDLTLVSADETMRRYPVKSLW